MLADLRVAHDVRVEREPLDRGVDRRVADLEGAPVDDGLGVELDHRLVGVVELPLARRAPVLTTLLAERVGGLLQIVASARLRQLEELLLLLGVELETRRPRIVEAGAAAIVERSLPRLGGDGPGARLELRDHFLELVEVLFGLLQVVGVRLHHLVDHAGVAMVVGVVVELGVDALVERAVGTLCGHVGLERAERAVLAVEDLGGASILLERADGALAPLDRLGILAGLAQLGAVVGRHHRVGGRLVLVLVGGVVALHGGDRLEALATVAALVGPVLVPGLEIGRSDEIVDLGLLLGGRFERHEGLARGQHLLLVADVGVQDDRVERGLATRRLLEARVLRDRVVRLGRGAIVEEQHIRGRERVVRLLEEGHALAVLLRIGRLGRGHRRIALLELLQVRFAAVLLDEERVHLDGLVVVADLLVGERAVHRGLGRLVARRRVLEGLAVERAGLAPRLAALGAVGHLLGPLERLVRVDVVASGPDADALVLGDLLVGVVERAAVREVLLGELARARDVIRQRGHVREPTPGLVAELGLAALLAINRLEALPGVVELAVEEEVVGRLVGVEIAILGGVGLRRHALDVLVARRDGREDGRRHRIFDDLLEIALLDRLDLIALLDALGALAAFVELVLIVQHLLRGVDDHERGRLEVLVVLVRVTHRDSAATGGVDLVLRGRAVHRHEDDDHVVVGVGQPVAALVSVGRVLVLPEVALPALRGELVLGERAFEDRIARLLVAHGQRLLNERAARVGVVSGRATKPAVHQPLRRLDRLRIVLVRVDPARVAHVRRELGAGVERLGRIVAPLDRALARLRGELVVDVGDLVLHHGGVAVHRPLLEDQLVDLDGVAELIQLAILLRERLVDIDRPLLVLRDQLGILHPIDGDAHLLLGNARVGLEIEDVVARDVRLIGGGAGEVQIRERTGDVRVRLRPEIGARIARQLLLLIRVAEQLDEGANAGLVALLLEVGPSQLVHGDAVDRRLLVLDRALITRLRAVVVERAARRVDLVEIVVADEPPDLGDVARLLPGQRLLRNGLAVVGEGVSEGQLVIERCGRALLLLPLLLHRRDRAVRLRAALAGAEPGAPDRQRMARFPASPVVAIVILRELLDGVLLGVLRVGRGRVCVLVVTDQRSPDLLRLGQPARVVVRVAEVVIDARELAVLRELLDDALVERDRRLEADGEILTGVGVGAGPLLVERCEAEHRVGRVLRVRVDAAVLGHERLEATNGLFARVAQALLLGRDLGVERRENAALAIFVVVLDDAGDRRSIVASALLVTLCLFLELGQRGELLGRGRGRRRSLLTHRRGSRRRDSVGGRGGRRRRRRRLRRCGRRRRWRSAGALLVLRAACLRSRCFAAGGLLRL